MEELISVEEFNTLKNTYTSLSEETVEYCGKQCLHYIDDSTNTIVLKVLFELDEPVAYIKTNQ